jgi:hypothetical protein
MLYCNGASASATMHEHQCHLTGFQEGEGLQVSIDLDALHASPVRG